MFSSLLAIILLLLNLQRSAGEFSRCPRTVKRGTKPLYVLTLVSTNRGLAVLPGHRIAQDEINNRTDLLPGYHIELIVDTIEGCSSPLVGLGLSNLLKYTVNPPCRPVVAVAGLGCSSHTSALSPMAGHAGFDLVQLSAANSPIFETRNERFRHLWRFLGSAAAYTNVVIAIMDQFNWTRIGIVYNTESLFHSEIAKHLEHTIKHLSTKFVTFDLGIRETRDFYLNAIISSIKDTKTTIIVSLLEVHQTEAMLYRILQHGLVYPQYAWIHIEKVQQYFQNNTISNVAYTTAASGHIYLHTQTHHQQEQTMLISGETFSAFREKVSDDLSRIKVLYNASHLKPLMFADNWYDQLWALALAMNKSLPILRNRNLSIDDYTLGQREITAIIEEQMSKLSFQGAGGWVKFNQHRSVSSPVEVYWILDHGNDELVGLYDPLKPTEFYVQINSSNMPNDTLYWRYELIVIPLPMAITLYSLAGVVMLLTTTQLLIYLHYRKHEVIKATSPYLSLLMFGGCYLLILSAILFITYDSFAVSAQAYIVLLCVSYLISMNAISLILITLFFKLLRIERIFFSKLRKNLGKCWNNITLLIMAILLTLLVNIILIPLLLARTPSYKTYCINTSDLIRHKHIRPDVRENFIGAGVVMGYLVGFLLVTNFLAFRTRKVKYKNFKNTKKINLFIILLLVTTFFTAVIFITLNKKYDESNANIVLIFGILLIPFLCQLVLFTPKILPIILFKKPAFQFLSSTLKNLSTNYAC